MKDYIKRIRRIGPNDAVNGEVLNSVVQQLQHNIDLLYGSQNNSRQDKSLAELLFGNILDYDQIGYKRFVNGGNMDAIEKIIAFDVSSGVTQLEEQPYYTGEYFLSWSIDENIVNNIQLIRTVKVPEALLGQKLLVGIKLMGFSAGNIITNERFDIYVNNTYCGSGDTGIISLNGENTFKSIYGVYDLGSEESSIEVRVVRSITNINTPANYIIRVQNMFVGFHVISNTSYELNFPSKLGPLSGNVPDINYFYNFDNVSVVPNPSFFFSSMVNTVSGATTPYVINITSQAQPDLDTYYVGPVGTGDQTGIDSSNRMSYTTFFGKTNSKNSLNVIFSSSSAYSDFIFDDGGVYNLTFEGDAVVSGQGLLVQNSSQVNIMTDYPFTASNINVYDSNIFFSDNGGVSANKLTINNNFYAVNSEVVINTGIFSMPISGDGVVNILDRSFLGVILTDTDYTNNSAQYGFGFSTGNIKINNYSSLDIKNNNTNLLGHIGYGDGLSASLYVNNHSSLYAEGIELSTSSNIRQIKAFKHSSVEVEHIQKDGGATAFQNYDLNVFSSLSTTGISGISGTKNQSYTYEF
jgi:hypothetical protein